MADTPPIRLSAADLEARLRAIEERQRAHTDEQRRTTARVGIILDILEEQTPLDVEVKEAWLARETLQSTFRDWTRDPWVRKASAVLILALGLGLLAMLGVAVDLPELVRAARGVTP